uniref:transforming growth factor-beta receptor-associated protein 1-like n=1 Tax=Ciona intestinalis TaxID=7719 RepID=UPI00089DB6EC|nr:transforming growth factor-beta receptor-associated protein 1-like [Ciona intestinalis]|eukprot:XP_018671538.1 transforming growth factor-beta receptor-associated protein 1-like [Ciona intestinalis]
MALKVFDLKLVLGREHIIGDKRTCIESIETNGRNVYLGTNDGNIHHYLLNIEESRESKTVEAIRQTVKQIGTKKSISQISAAPALNHLVVNCEGNLLLLSMLDLSVTNVAPGKLKNITSFCVNRRPMHQNPFTVEICVAFNKKRVLQIYQVSKDSSTLMQELSLPEQPKSFSMDGKAICVATSTTYIIINCETGTRQELMSIGEDGMLSMVSHVGVSEFLISASNALGVFVSIDGTSNRPPLQWSDGVFNVAVAEPYLTALNDEFVTVHSLLDNQQKQSIPLRGGNLIRSCVGGMILLCTAKDVMVLIPVSLETQLQGLFNSGSVEAALSLVQSSKKRLSKSKYETLWSRACCMAGFIQLAQFDFEAAKQYFLDGSMDPRELISLFPGLVPSSSSFIPSVPALHNLSNIQQVCSDDKNKLEECKTFLAAYLEELCNTNTKPDVFYATVLVLAQLGKKETVQQIIEMKNAENQSFLETLDQNIVEEMVFKLKEVKCFHQLALVHLHSGDTDDAMKIWKSIVTCDISDESFPGVGFVVSELSHRAIDAATLWKNAEWILQCDQHSGAQLFIDIFNNNNESLNVDNVVSFLHEFPIALCEYLYHLVIVCKVQKEKLHTHIAVMFLEQVLSLHKSQEDKNSLEEARKKLQEILRFSNLYRVHLILNKVQEFGLFAEQVILHSKLGEHDKALEILVHNLSDPLAAKNYCIEQGEGNDKFRQQLFHSLLSVYFSDISATRGSSGSVTAAIDILNEHPEDFNWESVLHLIPTQWSVSLIRNFLEHVLRDRIHGCRSRKIERSLIKSEVLFLHREQHLLHSRPVVIHENRVCNVCNRTLSDSPLARYPNGVVIHAHCCKNKYVCPVTGKLFKKPEHLCCND